FFFFSSRRRHTRWPRDWSSDVCSSDLKVEKTSHEESEEYFHMRPIGAQLGAWASHQSEVIDARRILDARLEEMKQRFAEGQIPLPPHWGGYRLKPDRIEFWQGRPDRLHDRFRYTLQSNGSWP